MHEECDCDVDSVRTKQKTNGAFFIICEKLPIIIALVLREEPRQY